MSNIQRKFNRRKAISGGQKKNTRGMPKGPPSTPPLRANNGGHPTPLVPITKHHMVGKAKKDCPECRGTGVASTVLVKNSRVRLACACVPIEADDE